MSSRKNKGKAKKQRRKTAKGSAIKTETQLASVLSEAFEICPQADPPMMGRLRFDVTDLGDRHVLECSVVHSDATTQCHCYKEFDVPWDGISPIPWTEVCRFATGIVLAIMDFYNESVGLPRPPVDDNEWGNMVDELIVKTSLVLIEALRTR